jgi:3-deoxy-D-manno-octulosonic acid kinase
LSAGILRSRHGAILYDTALLAEATDAMFSAAGWATASPLTGRLRAAGRGSTMIVANDQGEFVLRHSVRGGLIGRIVADSYLWTGEERTRAFSEWRLLAELRGMDLPVPRPAAARYVRSGPVYRADLLTVRIQNVMALSERIASVPCRDEFWQQLGSDIGAFHRAGVCHADLNAYNILIGTDDKLWLVDFDRGSLRQPGSWQQKNLDRLHRSLAKVKRLDPETQFCEADWQQFLDGYLSSSRSA